MERERNSDNQMVYGIRAVTEAIESGKEVDVLFVLKDGQGEQFQRLRNLARDHNVQVKLVPMEKLHRMTRGNHQGAIAMIAPISYASLENLVPKLVEEGKVPFLVILDGVTDVRNLGAIARTAVCAGAHALIIPEQNSARVNEDAIKTSAGALFQLPVCKVKNTKEALWFLKHSGIKVVACTEKARLTVYDDYPLQEPVALMFGAEGDGISEGLLKIADVKIALPMEGNIGSLNVSVAAGVFLYEVLRRRSLAGVK